MKDDESSLFDRTMKLNRARNDAIHNGIEVTRSQAREACRDVFDVLDYINSVAVTKIALPSRPTFPND